MKNLLLLAILLIVIAVTVSLFLGYRYELSKSGLKIWQRTNGIAEKRVYPPK